MKIAWRYTALLVLAASVAVVSRSASAPLAPIVSLETTLGSITVALNFAAAPITACNFVRYAADGRYDNGSFFRVVRYDQGFGNSVPIDVVQGDGPTQPSGRDRGPINLERTRDTGLSHVAGTISMARDGPDTATTSFFIVVRDSVELDFGGRRNPDGQGFAAFGHVTSGMDVVERIYSRSSNREAIQRPVKILSARVIRGQSTCAGQH